MRRITIKDLRACVEEINDRLLERGSDRRIEQGGRNGYQAIDVYAVDADNKRMGSGVLRNVQCGSSRECIDAAWLFYYQELDHIHQEA
jgi:hypothetical protein